jgi:hypothetical protein
LSDGRSAAAELAGARAQALAALAPLLRDCADEWALYEYDQPFLFASYWSADAPGGRIHVSPQVWGQDRRRCPGIDYVWQSSLPGAAYQTYWRGLTSLRARARLLDGTFPKAQNVTE